MGAGNFSKKIVALVKRVHVEEAEMGGAAFVLLEDWDSDSEHRSQTGGRNVLCIATSRPTTYLTAFTIGKC